MGIILNSFVHQSNDNNTSTTKEAGSSSLFPDISDLVDLADFRYCVPYCFHSYINMIEILKIFMKYYQLSSGAAEFYIYF